MIKKFRITEDLDNIIYIIQSGGILLWPSGGVYGLLCDAKNEDAVKTIYKIKKRPFDKPLQIISSRLKYRSFIEPNPIAELIIQTYWPDFIGLIVHKTDKIPDMITINSKFTSIVCSNKIAEILSDNCKCPIASTSANISGEHPIKSVEEAINLFDKSVDGIILPDDNLTGFLNTLIKIEYNSIDNTSVLEFIREGKYSVKEVQNMIENIKKNKSYIFKFNFF